MKKKLLFLLLLLIPTFVFAKAIEGFSIIMSLFVNAFITIHMSLFVMRPLSEIYAKGNSKPLFWKMFTFRIVLLLFLEIFVDPAFAILDFVMVFIGAFVVVPVSALIGVIIEGINNKKMEKLCSKVGNGETCTKCGAPVNNAYAYCINCGTKNPTVIPKSADAKLTVKSFESMYQLSDKDCLETFIKKQMTAAGYDFKTKLIPPEIVKRRMVMYTIFAILIGLLVAMIFFHFPLITYIIGIAIIVFVYFMNNKFDIMKFLQKKVKERPGEKISNIVMSVKENLVEDTSKKILTGVVLTAVIIPLIIFIKPRIMYERVEDGYAVRFYTFGITNFTSATIPETHKGKDVVQLRGNTFSNMPFLSRVTLPDTIKEIRGQAFKNCYSLKEVNIPNKLERIGGGAFYNCKSLKSVEFPDTLVEMGGEIFKNATKLESVRLSQNITEIRGDSFENCSSLEEIEIPDKVTRIGGHAFYGNSKLSYVGISKDSQLEEIGSSAFRQCPKLSSIKLPLNTVVNERAFKESPTYVSRFISSSYTGNEYEEYRDLTLYSGGSSVIYSRTSGNDWVIRLDNITVRDSIIIYSFELSGEMYDTFELSSVDSSHVVSEDLEIELLDGSTGSYGKIGIYYN